MTMRDHFDPTRTVLLPIHAVRASTIPTALPGVIRSQESIDHNTRHLQCRTFYKPISRCLTPHGGLLVLGKKSTDDPCEPIAITDEAVFKLFANCLPVKGAFRSTICDLQNGSFCFIPNALFYILTELQSLTIGRTKARFAEVQHAIIDQYFRFLLDNELGFLCDEAERFPPMNLTFLRSEQITNAIIDVRIRSDHPYDDILVQLSELGCSAIQFRFFDEMSLAQIEGILRMTRRHALRHVDIVVRYTPEMSDEALLRITTEYPAISGIRVHSAPVTRDVENLQKIVRISFRQSSYDAVDHCGFVHPTYFAINLEHFSEAQNFNTCLNRKISIDAAGTIKNCPALHSAFGNVRTTRLAEVAAMEQFQEMWAIKKDDIEVCSACEFRYICTDCRAQLTDLSDIRSKPAKCGYDPYKGTWSEVSLDA